MALEVCINTVYKVLSNLELTINMLKDVVNPNSIKKRRESTHLFMQLPQVG